MLNSKEATAWLKEPENKDAFTESFATGSYIKGRRYNLVAPSISIIFNPDSAEQLREVEEVNGLPCHGNHSHDDREVASLYCNDWTLTIPDSVRCSSTCKGCLISLKQ